MQQSNIPQPDDHIQAVGYSGITLEHHLVDKPDTLIPLEYPGLLAQTEFASGSMSIIPSIEELKFLLEDKGLYQADKDKYFEIIKKIVEGNKLQVDLKDPISLQDLLKFTLGSVWLVTGSHDEISAEDMLFRQGGVHARELVDLENPPITKCSFFNSAFVYLFEAACRYFQREELLQNYQFILIKRPTHVYLGLVSMKNGMYRISAIDPYHTNNRDGINKQGIDVESMYKILDRTNERRGEILASFKNALKYSNT